MPDFLPLQPLLATFGGWVNRHQAHAIEYLNDENLVLREQLDGRRLRLTDDQRRRLAAKGKRLGRPLLHRVATIVTADTILRWHSTFLTAHKDAIAATDFFTPEVWTRRGLVTDHVLFVIHHATRAVEIVGCTPHPDGPFMARVARGMIDVVDGALVGRRFLILDRDR